jgi:hypothetical protein
VLTDPGWLPTRHLDDLLPDHGHLMHLFVVRTPGLDTIAHLHPTESAPGHFTQALPALPAGTYQLFADIVHANGLGETATTMITLTGTLRGFPNPPATDSARQAELRPRDLLPQGLTAAATGDDAVGTGAPIASAALPADATPAQDPVATLPDGTRVVWLREREGQVSAAAANANAPVAPLVAGRATWFRFHVEDRDGTPARDVVPYMGMAGHAVFLRHDRSVFAHVHPSGSVPMAALALIAAPPANGGADPHAGHHMGGQALPAEIAFPYACPRPGDYRIFVQFRRGAGIETAIFDVPVR